MKRVLDDDSCTDEVLPSFDASTWSLLRQLVFQYGLTEGPIFLRWQFAIKLMQVCQSTRLSALVRHVGIYYCTVHAVMNRFYRFLQNSQDAFLPIRVGFIESVVGSTPIELLNHMFSDWALFTKRSDTYSGGPGFRTIPHLACDATGLIFRPVLDMAVHIRNGHGAMDVFFGFRALDVASALAFIYFMRKTKPTETILVDHSEHQYIVVYPDDTCKRFYTWNTTVDSKDLLLPQLRHLIVDDLSMETSYRKAMCWAFDRACEKEGSTIEKLGFFLHSWYHDHF